MAEHPIKHILNLGLVTHTGDTNWTNKVSLSGLVGSTKYIIWVTALVGGSDVAKLFEYDVAADTTELARSFLNKEATSTVQTIGCAYEFVGSFTTAATPETIHFRLRTADSLETVDARRIQIIAIPWDAAMEMAESIDTSGPTNHTASYVVRNTLTWTPASAGDDWLILSCSEYAIDSISKNLFIDLVDASDTPYRREWQWEGEDNAENIPVGIPFRMTSVPASLQTVKLRSRDESAAGQDNDYLESYIVAINLSKFESHLVLMEDSAGQAVVAADTWEELIDGGTYTPATTGNHVVYWDVLFDINNINVGLRKRVQYDGVTIPTWDETFRHSHGSRNTEATSEYNAPMLSVKLLSSAGQDIDLDGYSASTADGVWYDSLLIVFSFELAAVGDALVTPATLNGVAAFSVPTVNTSSKIAATTLSGVAAFPVPTVLGGTGVSPATLNGVAQFPTPAVRAGSKVSPATLNGVAQFPQPIVAIVRPTTLSGVASFPVPTVNAGSKVTAATLSGVVVFPVPTLRYGGKVIATTLSGVAVFPTPVVGAGAEVIALTLSGAAAFPIPTVRAGAKVTATTLNGVVAIPTPTVLGGGDAKVFATTLDGIAAFPVPTVNASSKVTALTLNGVAQFPGPKVGAGVTASTLSGIAQFPTPTIRYGAKVTTTTHTSNASFPIPTMSGGARVTVSTLSGVAAFPVPIVNVGSKVTVTTLTGNALFPMPTLRYGGKVTAVTLSGVAAFPTPTLPSEITRDLEVIKFDLFVDRVVEFDLQVDRLIDFDLIE